MKKFFCDACGQEIKTRLRATMDVHLSLEGDERVYGGNLCELEELGIKMPVNFLGRKREICLECYVHWLHESGIIQEAEEFEKGLIAAIRVLPWRLGQRRQE